MGSTISSDRIKRTKVEIGTKVNAVKPSSDELVDADAAYYGVMELVDWYTEEPEENEDGSFKFNPEAKVTDDTLVAKGTKLYAKTKVREGQKISISLSAYTLIMRKLSSWAGTRSRMERVKNSTGQKSIC